MSQVTNDRSKSRKSTAKGARYLLAVGIKGGVSRKGKKKQLRPQSSSYGAIRWSSFDVTNYLLAALIRYLRPNLQILLLD